MLLAASLIPPLYLLWKVYHNDKIEKEPVGLLVTIFLLGMVSTLPAGILETIGQALLSMVFDPVAQQLPSSTATTVFNMVFYFLIVGGAEELVKYLAMRIPTWKNPEFNYVFDGVVYGVTSALGFAALENVLYVMDSGLLVAGIRAWTAIPLHCITGIYMGHYYGIAKAADRWNETRVRDSMLRKCILIPLLIHGFYDFIATSENEILIGLFFVYIIILDILAIRSLKRYAGNDVQL
ncbi:MAG: PrsW family intramembrane metalloprotease [Eubacteriales bacterium]|nr:PrsW family intramembrane metalloprotease [Eubacteriales bacterium]